MNLSDATVLVTGANRGIGRAVASELATRCERVYAGVRDPNALEPFSAGDLRAEVIPVRLDLSSRESIDECVAAADGLRDVDVLVNNAGQIEAGLLEAQDVDQIYRMLQVNLTGAMHLTRLLLPPMLERRRGQIVNNASISGYVHFPLTSTYAASKAGLVAFSEALRRELRGTGVTVTHLVTPGVETDMLGDTTDIYAGHYDTSGWHDIPAGDWASIAANAIEQDQAAVFPRDRQGVALKLTEVPRRLLDRIAARSFRREP